MANQLRGLSIVRQDATEAERILADLFPKRRDRRQALQILADTINRANRVAPASWGVSLFAKRVCLNVGRGAVLQFYSTEITFIVTGTQLKMVAKSCRSAFRFNARYRFVNDAIEGRLGSEYLSLYRDLSSAHADLVERAAADRKVCFWIGAHSPAVLTALRKFGLAVPDPDYSVRDGALDVAPAPDLDELDRATIEGRRTLRTHLRIERDSGLAERKRQWALTTNHRLACEVCAFDFSEFYGSVGYGFAEVHHRLPLSAARERTTRLKDLAVVCSNCHRMLHRGSPLFSIAELRARLRRGRITRKRVPD